MQLVTTMYPDHDWLPWKFARCPDGYWNDMKNQKQFMDWASKELKIHEMNDWYKVSYKVTLPLILKLKIQDLCDIGGGSLLNSKYNASPLQLLSDIYPEYNWLPWKFAVRCPRNFWESVENQRKFMDWAGKQLNVKEMSDWYKVSFRVTDYL
jgi:hypothetical protein